MAVEDDIESGLILDTEKDAPEIIRRYIKKYREFHGPNAKRNIVRSNKWFMRRVSKDTKISRDKAFMQFKSEFRKRTASDKGLVGRMFAFHYDAKHKDTLPVWDSFPLVMFFGVFVGDGVYGENGIVYAQGINFHYLPMPLRLKLFTTLIKYNNDTSLRDKAKLKITWQILKSFSQSDLAKHAVKTYRADHMKSQLIEISPKFWEIVLFMQLQKFEKGSNSLAWKGSKK